MPEADAIERFVPKLQEVARVIGQDFIDQHNTDSIASRTILPTDPDADLAANQ